MTHFSIIFNVVWQFCGQSRHFLPYVLHLKMFQLRSVFPIIGVITPLYHMENASVSTENNSSPLRPLCLAEEMADNSSQTTPPGWHVSDTTRDFLISLWFGHFNTLKKVRGLWSAKTCTGRHNPTYTSKQRPCFVLFANHGLKLTGCKCISNACRPSLLIWIWIRKLHSEPDYSPLNHLESSHCIWLNQYGQIGNELAVLWSKNHLLT